MIKAGDYVTFTYDEVVTCTGYVMAVNSQGGLLVKITQSDKKKYIGQMVNIRVSDVGKTGLK